MTQNVTVQHMELKSFLAHDSK